MKNTFAILSALLVLNLTVAAQTTSPSVVKLKGTRLTHPLVNKWISEFNKEYPNIKVSIAQNAPSDSIDFSIASYALKDGDLTGSRTAVIVSRYVQLPVVNSKREGLAALQEKGITDKDLSDLFFTKNTPVVLASAQTKSPLALYVRDKPVCAVKAFAAHSGNDATKINGTGINGDDQDLATAVRNDVNGFSFNNLGFIYDTRTRKITNDLAVVPLDLNENGKIDKDEKIYETLDDVIAYIEKTKNPKFVNERVNFIYDKESTNKSAAIFLNWVLTKGQKFNHDLGFINQEEADLTVQKNILKSSFKISSAASCDGLDEIAQQRKAKKTVN